MGRQTAVAVAKFAWSIVKATGEGIAYAVRAVVHAAIVAAERALAFAIATKDTAARLTWDHVLHPTVRGLKNCLNKIDTES